MPIMIPNGLPAAKTLAAENIFVMNETRAVTQDIRPLQILVLNLMPTKIATETQLSRLLGNTPLQVELELIHTDSHESKNTSREHLLKFYQTFEDVKERWFDGLIITGAPVEQMPFEQVEYWPELCRIMEWSRTHVHSTFHICWGAQAGLYYHYGIGKTTLPEKLFGVYPHRVERRSSMLMRGFDDVFMVPAFAAYKRPARGYRAVQQAENSCLVRTGRSLRYGHGGRSADFHHRPLGIRCRNAGIGVPAR